MSFGPSVAEVAYYSSVLLRHTYTRTPVDPGPDDANYNETSVPGAPTAGVRCQARGRQRLQTTDGSWVTVDAPALFIAESDPLQVGDLVSDIKNEAGVVILAGPLTVETILPRDLGGSTMWRLAQLSGGRVAE